jgi:hypothetical protein
MSTTDSHHRSPRYPNLIKGMIISGLNQVWLADITYIRIQTDRKSIFIQQIIAPASISKPEL